MAYRNNTLEKHFNQATANLAALRAEQENIQAKQIHTGFIDASTRARLSYEVEALDRRCVESESNWQIVSDAHESTNT